MPIIDPVLEELKRIHKILLLANSEKIEQELSKVATSNERKKIWILINGKLTAKQIANKIGIHVRSVNRFLEICERVGFIENLWGKPPRKKVDYIPSSWFDVFEKR